jgi:hypothetical protein
VASAPASWIAFAAVDEQDPEKDLKNAQLFEEFCELIF